jgi:drug/metabolite transporter (DMT)-like permease
MKIKALANTYLLLALVLGALLPVMLVFTQGMSIYEYLFLAYLVSVPTSLLFVLATGRKEKLVSYLKNRRDFAIVAAIGLLNYAFLEFGLTYAERFVSASLAAAVYRSYPILMLAFIPFILREKVTKYQLAALSLGFAGLYIAFSGGTLSLFSNANVLIVLLLSAVAIASAIATLLVKRYVYDMESSMFIFNLANFAFFSFLFLINGHDFGGITTMGLLSVLYLGIVYNVFVGFMYYGALRMMKTTFVTNIYFLSPFLTFVFAHFLLGETIQPYYIAIAVLVSAGILIQRLDAEGGSYLPSKRANISKLTLFDVTGAFANTGNVAISSAIRNGGRVLAVRIPAANRKEVSMLLESNKYTNVFTHEHETIPEEGMFVKEILGAKGNDLVVMKAGSFDEGEEFFGEISSLVDIKGE